MQPSKQRTHPDGLSPPTPASGTAPQTVPMDMAQHGDAAKGGAGKGGGASAAAGAASAAAGAASAPGSWYGPRGFLILFPRRPMAVVPPSQ